MADVSAPAAPRMIQGSSQSPRAHRCCRRGDLVVRRELLEELDVGDEPCPREDALEQIVAQERILRDAALQRPGERLDVIDALAGVCSKRSW